MLAQLIITTTNSLTTTALNKQSPPPLWCIIHCRHIHHFNFITTTTTTWWIIRGVEWHIWRDLVETSGFLLFPFLLHLLLNLPSFVTLVSRGVCVSSDKAKVEHWRKSDDYRWSSSFPPLFRSFSPLPVTSYFIFYFCSHFFPSLLVCLMDSLVWLLLLPPPLPIISHY